MAVLSPPLMLGATGQQVSGKLLRLSLGAAWRPAATALSAVPGVLHGPAGSMMEVTLVNPTTLGVNPGVAVIQGTHSGDQGQYVVPNDAYATFAVTGQHASQYRRSLLLVEVNDSQAAGVASSGTTDRARLHVLDGALSATSPGALPAVPANSLVLGEVAIPPTGQTVTWTPYSPRTTVRGGILPVIADALTYPGHGGELPAFDGQYRDHPTYGLQRGYGGVWGPPADSSASGTPSELPYNAAAGVTAYNDAGAGWTGMRYWKRNGVATVQGAFRTSSGLGNLGIIGTLPTGFRPPATIQATPGGAVFTDGTVRTGGVIAANGVASIGATFPVA